MESQPVYYNNSTAKPKGMPTGSWVRVLLATSNTDRNLTYSLYDQYARPIHTRTNTYLGGYNRVDTKFAFSGRTDYTVTRHKRVGGDAEMYIKDAYTYSDQDRLVTHLHRIGTAGTYQLMAKNEYTELGQLIGKKTGGTSTTAATFYQNTSYKYNVRGWLTGINDTANLTQGSDPVDLFAFKINYNTIQQLLEGYVPGIERLYNGNISETFWRTASDNVLRKYSYKYDNLNRLRSAHYQKPNNSVIVTNSYNESMSYDKNGNIMSLHRNGEYDDSGTALEIDDLDYTYNPEKPNELLKVTDDTNDPNGFNDDSDGTNDTTDDYEYDGNGNLIADENKNITKITYNHLNLPVRIRFDSGSIDYVYDATGTKLRKTVSDQQNTTVTDYLGGFQYLNTKLDFFGTAQGFVKNTIRNEVNNYHYVFTFTDHLGNVRLSYGIDPGTGQLGILEENNYYAYGLKHKNYNVSKREYKAGEDGISLEDCETCPGIKVKYNGKEWQDELGLNVTAMDYRQYDNAIGRFNGIDALAEFGYSNTPYHFAGNNPVYYSDPTGLIQGGAAINAMWSATGDGMNSYWTADSGGNFDNDDGSGWVSAAGEYFATLSFQLDQVNVVASSYSDSWDFVQQMTYETSPYYQDYSTKVSSSTVEPTSMKLTEVIGNSLTVVDFIRNSAIGKFVRNGRPPIASISNFLKTTGNVLGGIGIAYGVYQYANNEISGLEFTVDTVIAGAAIVASVFAAPVVATAFAVGAIAYFGGKAIYEYSSGKTMYQKPIKQ